MQKALADPSNIPGPPTARIGKENSPRLITLTVEQIIKDFGMFGYPIHYKGKPEDAYDQLSKELRMVVEENIRDGYAQLLELLAKIGISEQTIKEKIGNKVNQTVAESISALILEKEFMKVYTREGRNGDL